MCILNDYNINFEQSLRENWIDFWNPTFFETDKEFFEKVRRKNCNLDADMKHYMSEVDQIWFFSVCGLLMIQKRCCKKKTTRVRQLQGEA